MKIKKGDKVIMISGKDKGKSGTVVHALPKENRVVVEGLNMVKKHRRASRGAKGQIIEKPLSIHVSNVQIADPKTGKGTRIKIDRSKGYARIAVKSGASIK